MASWTGPDMPRPERGSQLSNAASAWFGGEEFALWMRPCLDRALGVTPLCANGGAGEARSSLLERTRFLLLPLPPTLLELPWLRAESGRAVALLGTGVATVTVCRCEPGVAVFAEDLVASFGVILGVAGVLFASAGI